MLAHLAVVLAVVAVADPSSEVCASGTCSDAKGRYKSSMLLQSKSSMAMADAVDEDDGEHSFEEDPPPDPYVPHEVERAIVEKRNRQPREGLTDLNEEEAWIDMKDFDTSESVEKFNAKKMHDGKSNTHGGAVELIMDMGQVYQMSETQIDFRLCQCSQPGSVMCAVSMDKTCWYTYLSPTLHVWGGHVVLPEKHHSLRARYVKCWVTSLAETQFLGIWEIKIKGKLDPDSHPNVYGWWHSYRAGVNNLGGTEIVQLHAYQGKLFAGTGYWMNDKPWRAAEVARLDCPFCDWIIENVVYPYAGRTEILKSVEWRTNHDGKKLSSPVPKLLSGFYIKRHNEGECYVSVRDDETLNWHLLKYMSGPWEENRYSARALQAYQDPETGVSMVFVVSGLPGIVACVWKWDVETKMNCLGAEKGSQVPVRPLALTTMDNMLYFSAGSQIFRRKNGGSPSWSMIWDEAEVDDSGTVDEAVGGIRGLVSISNPTTTAGQSLLFSWAPNGRSQACMIRLDPKPEGETYDHVKEKCVKEMAQQYLGSNVNGLSPKVTYSLADYNYALEIDTVNGDGSEIEEEGHAGMVHLIGYQILLFGYSTTDFPVDPSQTVKTASGKFMGYYVGAGYLIRRGPDDYEAREPGGRRYDPSAIFPKLVAVRALAKSPWPGDCSVYMAGHDCNFFSSNDTAWIMSASEEAVFKGELPCQPELGCGHVPGEEFHTKGCDWCGFREFAANKFVGWGADGSATTCQAIMNFLNSDGGKSHCEASRTWASHRECCLGHRCNLCHKTKKTFNPARVAGKDSSGQEYLCHVAQDHVDSGLTTCWQGRKWWKKACCQR